jgi:hypothetical protein
MNWIWDHLQLIIAVAGAVAWWLNQHKRAQAGEEEAPPPEEPTFADPVLAERTRRIREEIQRKIDQRAKGYAAEQPRQPVRSDVEEPPPVFAEEVEAPPPVVPRRVSARPDAARQAEILEQQASLLEQLQAVKVMKAAEQKRVAFEAATADHTAEALAQTRLTVLEDLQAPESLRRAFILREVLGPPVALR